MIASPSKDNKWIPTKCIQVASLASELQGRKLSHVDKDMYT